MRNQSPGCDSNGRLFFPPADPVTFLIYVSSHLGRVTDDYFRGDPVSDTVSICEQPLEVAI